MSQVHKSLDAASSIGPGTVLDLHGLSNDYYMFVQGGSATFEGSLDGANWFPIPKPGNNYMFPLAQVPQSQGYGYRGRRGYQCVGSSRGD